MVVPSYLVSVLLPFDYCKKTCMHHNSVTVIYTYMKLDIGMCIRSIRRIGYNYGCFSFQSYGPLNVVF